MGQKPPVDGRPEPRSDRAKEARAPRPVLPPPGAAVQSSAAVLGQSFSTTTETASAAVSGNRAIAETRQAVSLAQRPKDPPAPAVANGAAFPPDGAKMVDVGQRTRQRPPVHPPEFD